MTRSFWQIRSGESAIAYDVLIVGAGITGTSTAWWLRRLDPRLRVGIVERGEVASGASGRNAGFLLKGIATNFADAVRVLGDETASWFYRFTKESIERLISNVPATQVALERRGSFLAAGDAVEAAELKESEALLREKGERVEYWSDDLLASRLHGSGFHGGLFDPTGAEVDPVRLVRYLAASSGAALHTLHDVTAIESGENRHRIETSRGAFSTPILVLATNAFLPQLLPQTASLVRPVRAQMFAATAAGRFTLPFPVYSHYGYYYARTTRDGTLLMGGARHLHVDEEIGYTDATTPGLQADLEAYVRTHFPFASDLNVVHRWSGVMGFSPDGLPLIDRTPEGVLWAGGHTGHGMAFGFGVGRVLAELALGETTGDARERFSPVRLTATDSAPAPQASHSPKAGFR